MSNHTVVTVGPGSGGDGTAQIDVFVTETGPTINTPAPRQLTSMLNSFCANQWEEKNLATGDNNLFLPTDILPGMFILQLPPTNTTVFVQLSVFSNTSDQFIAKNGLTIWAFDQAHLPTAMVVKCSASLAGVKFAFI